MYHFRNVVTEVGYVMTSQVNTALQLNNLHLHDSHETFLSSVVCHYILSEWFIHSVCQKLLTIHIYTVVDGTFESVNN